MKSKIVITILGLVFIASSAYVEGSNSDKYNSEEWKAKKEARFEKMQKELNLTPEQAQRLKELRNQHREKRKNGWKDIRAKRQKLQEELQKPKLNEARVRQIHNELKALKAQKADQRLERILEVRKILTPEQFSKFMELTKKFKGERGKRGSHKGSHRFNDSD